MAALSTLIVLAVLRHDQRLAEPSPGLLLLHRTRPRPDRLDQREQMVPLRVVQLQNAGYGPQ
uniref:hypothetical protein n=1 Tax=Streptomyces sp. NRRL WC-3744 TaxID=1463935 RepID=UPI001F48FE47